MRRVFEKSAIKVDKAKDKAARAYIVIVVMVEVGKVLGTVGRVELRDGRHDVVRVEQIILFLLTLISKLTSLGLLATLHHTNAKQCVKHKRKKKLPRLKTNRNRARPFKETIAHCDGRQHYQYTDRGEGTVPARCCSLR
jgi:hypothetical protein